MTDRRYITIDDWRNLGGEREAERISFKDAFDSERHFEDALTADPDLLEDGLWLVGRQLRVSAGQIDLLGVGHDGQLIVFELKHGQIGRGALSQVLEYAAFIESLPASDLATLVSNSSGRNGIPQIADFAAMYEARFGERSGDEPFGVQAVLVSLAAPDEDSVRAITWLSDHGVRIQQVIYETYSDDEYVVLRPLWNPEPQNLRWWFPPLAAKRPELVDWISSEAAKTDCADLHAEILQMITAAFPSGRWVPRVNPDSLGLNWAIRGSNGKMVESITTRIYNHRPDQIFLMLFDEVLQYAPHELESALQPFIYGEGTRLGQPHGQVRWIDAEKWAEHGDALRNALAYAGAKHAKAIG